LLLVAASEKSSPSSLWWKTKKQTRQTNAGCYIGDVVVSALASINEVNQRRVRLVLRWATVSGFNSRLGTFIPVCTSHPSQLSLAIP